MGFKLHDFGDFKPPVFPAGVFVGDAGVEPVGGNGIIRMAGWMLIAVKVKVVLVGRGRDSVDGEIGLKI